MNLWHVEYASFEDVEKTIMEGVNVNATCNPDRWLYKHPLDYIISVLEYGGPMCKDKRHPWLYKAKLLLRHGGCVSNSSDFQQLFNKFRTEIERR